jgi:hypothetical protein
MEGIAKILENYRIVKIGDYSSYTTHSLILLNNKIKIEDFQNEMDRIKEEHKEEIEKWGDDLQVVLTNIDIKKFDFIEILYDDREKLYI